MFSLYSWLFVDSTNNIWKFLRNQNKELYYTVMYREGKWTKEKLIDKDVLDFYVCVEEEGNIHIVYCNAKAEIKYCTLIENQWMGKVLYELNSKDFEIGNLKVYIIGNEMHVFYLLIENDGSDHGVLMQCIWNGKETRINKLQDLIIIPDLKDNYKIKADWNNNFDILYITDEGNEKSLNYFSYQDSLWTSAKRLYGILADEIEFEILNDQQGMHILNKFREDENYYLEHVVLDKGDNFEKLRIHESKNEIYEPILFKVKNKLYSCWLEENNIFYSFFDGKTWSIPISYNIGNELEISKYHFCIATGRGENISQREVYGTGDLDFKLYLPVQFVMKGNKSFEPLKSAEQESKSAEQDSEEKEEEIQAINVELSHVKSENKDLEKKIASLSIQLKQKQRALEDSEMQVYKLMEQKQKVDENYNVFMELQQKLQQELEDTKKQLLDEKDCSIELEEKLKTLEEENNILREQIKVLTEENNDLYTKLDIEKNQTIMDRLLKRKNNEL